MELIVVACATVFIIYLLKKRSVQQVPKAKPKSEYRAVSIKQGFFPCEAVQDLGEQRFFPQNCPRLPLPACSAGKECECRYKHHEDRRNPNNERRVDNIALSPNTIASAPLRGFGQERRKFHRGRRWQERQGVVTD